MRVTKGKQARQLPTRGGLNDLAKTQRKITDYSKATPLDVGDNSPTALQVATHKRRRP